MDEAAFLEAVRSDNETTLTRLGSERALIAVTSASIDRETVLETSAAAEARAAATFAAWADDEDHEAAREAFAAAAERERKHRERVVELGDAADVEVPDNPEPDALHEHLRGLDDTLDRVGAGLVGRPLVASRTLLQVINFFVNEGERATADVFRDLRSETDEQAETGAALAVEIAGETAADRERTLAAAGRAIEVAYGEYADRLSAMGVDPKPVC